MGEILNKAIVYAVKAHNGQVRKGTQVPYILHPLEAASIVGTLTTDEEVIAAAVLHDVVGYRRHNRMHSRSLWGKDRRFVRCRKRKQTRRSACRIDLENP